jgi:hypothetical protein
MEVFLYILLMAFFIHCRGNYGLKFREYAKKGYSIDITGPPPLLKKMIIDWYEEE